MKKYHRLAVLAAAAVSFLCFKTIGPRADAAKSEKPISQKTSANTGHSVNALGCALAGALDTAKWKFPCDEKLIRKYTAYHVSKAPVIDGKLDEAIWKKLPKSTRYVDLISGKPTLYDTYAAICWDDENLYIGIWLEEPFVNGTFTNHNDLIYKENDAEVFIAGQNAYYEFEINSLNTRYEALFMWKEGYEKNGFSANDAFKLTNPLVKNFNGVGMKNHPRGLRYGSWDFEFPGMQSGTYVDGTINDSKDRDRQWTVELAFPWKGMEWIMKGDKRAIPPKDNDVWRIDFTRFNPYKEAAPAKDSGGWAWSPHGIWDSHVPECFPKITFSRKAM